MDLTPYVEALRRELMAAAEQGADAAMTQRLAASLAAATHLAMLDVLSGAAAEITREIAPDSVHVRLRGRDPIFVVVQQDVADQGATAEQTPRRENLAGPYNARDGAVSRINFRPPDQLKQRIEAAAGAEGLSTNAWLVRVTEAALTGDRPTPRERATRHFTGWVG